ncbi:MAG: DUF2288 family protein [Candidatus Sericytochromatia bacterium]|nr:DUF2288 family protein [Candidatus Sericytochromatia bacterium]
MMDLKEKLESEIGPANWNDLSVFAKRGTLIYLTDDLELSDVALKIATNDSLAIGKLLNENKLSKPEPEMLMEWIEQKLNCLIVDPFVLCQLQKDDI